MWPLLLAACLVNDDLYDTRLLAVTDNDGDGYAEADGDCDDQDPNRHPKAPESCDGEDDDCDGAIDEDTIDRTWYVDGDGDGHANPQSAVLTCLPPGNNWSLSADDCDDNNPAIFPGHSEQCDGVDEDCDGTIDNDPTDPQSWFADADEDTYGDPDSKVIACTPPTPSFVTNGLDCDDTNPLTHPTADELCDGADNDCDGHVDDPPLSGTSVFHPDRDDDGYGDADAESARCEASDGYVADGSDCDDADPTINPAAPEVCLDGVDNNCDGSANACAWPSSVDMEDYSSIYGVDPYAFTGGTASAADTNGDGRLDLALGTPWSQHDGVETGTVDIFRGNLMVDQPRTSATITYWGDHAEDGFGMSVDLCDVDGDGIQDALIGAAGMDVIASREGGIYTILGPHTSGSASSRADALVRGETQNDLGWFVMCGGTVGGSAGTLIAAHYGRGSSTSELTNGVVYLLNGLMTGTSTIGDAQLAAIFGEEAEDDLGVSATSLDVDGDGIDDLLTGARNAGRGGLAMLFLGPVTGTKTYLDADTLMEAEGYYTQAGEYVDNIGATNGDGLDDMIISASQAAHGAVYIVYSDTSLPTMLADAEVTIRNSDSSRIFGRGAYALGDLSGDGEGDILVAEGGAGPCDTHLFFGPFSTPGVYAQTDHDAVLHGDGTSDCYYSAALNLGDQNADGANDLMVASAFHNTSTTTYAGIAYIIPGYGW